MPAWQPRGHVAASADGNPPSLPPKPKAARDLYDAGGTTVADIARVLGCSRATLYRNLKVEADASPVTHLKAFSRAAQPPVSSGSLFERLPMRPSKVALRPMFARGRWKIRFANLLRRSSALS
jgi:hypothetical protein